MDQIVEGFDCEWLENRQILAFTAHAVNSAVVKLWSAEAIRSLEVAPKNRPFLVMYDVSAPGVGLRFLAAVEEDIFNIGILPGARSKVERIVAEHPDWKLVLALVGSTSLSSHFAYLLHAERAETPYLQSDIFFSRTAAISWLRKHKGGNTNSSRGG